MASTYQQAPQQQAVPIYPQQPNQQQQYPQQPYQQQAPQQPVIYQQQYQTSISGGGEKQFELSQPVTGYQQEFTSSYGSYEGGGTPDDEAQHRLMAADQIECAAAWRWIVEGFALYKQQWVVYSGIALLYMLIFIVPILFGVRDSLFLSISSWLVWPLYYGYFISGSRIMKERELLSQSGADVSSYSVVFMDMLRGFLVYCPLLGLEILLSLIVAIGLILLIIPGIYLLVTLYLVPFVYIEYHRQLANDELPLKGSPGVTSQSLDFCECFGHCRRVCHRHFWVLLLFFIFCIAITILGTVTVIGSLLSLPIVGLAVVPAFRDLFGLQAHRSPDTRCYCCCNCA